MAQRTGTTMLARARVHAGDNDAQSNFGVGAADALIIVNDNLMRWTTNVKSKPKYVPASTTGLSFTSGLVYKETGDNTSSSPSMRISAFESFHSANTSSLSFPLPPELEVVTVDQIRALLGFDGDTALSAQASEWQCVAYEKTQDATAAGADKWRVWAYPVINRDRHLTVRATVYTQLSAIGDTPDLDEHDANILERFIAYDIATANRMPQDKLAAILAPVPADLVAQMHGGVMRGARAQDFVEWRDW